MATQVHRITGSTIGNFGLTDYTADQAAASRADGWTVAKIAAARSSDYDAGTKQASGTFSTTLGPASFLTGTTANAFRSLDPITGQFAATAWTIQFAVRATTASSQRGRIRIRVFASSDAAGAGARELTSATQIGTTTAALSTSADQNSTVTWSPGVINLNNEYLFFVLAWEITTASGSNSGDVVIRTGSSPTVGSVITTPDFQVIYTPTYTTLIDDFNRADGLIQAGAGAAIWKSTILGGAAQANASVISNQLTSSAPSYAPMTVKSLDSDCDVLWDCVVTPAGGNSTFYICCEATDTSTFNAISVGYDVSSGAWWGTKYTGGGGGSSLGSRAGSAPVAGETVWISKRGTVVSLYKGPTGGAFSLIGTYSATGNPGSAGFILGDTTQRWDNFRGGPFLPVPDDETLLDDFNRADGKVSAGAGASLWNTTDWQMNVGVSHTSIVSNAIAAPSTFSAGAVSIFRLADDLDLLIDCVTPGTGTDRGQFDICVQGYGAQVTYDGYSFRFTASAVTIYRMDNGSATNIGSGSITLAAGDTIWMQKRGSALKLYRKPTGSSLYTLIASATDANYGFGAVSIDPGNTTVARWDNLRGGPLYVPPVPLNETVYDDFNRADDFVYNGGGSSLWETNRLDVAVATQAKVISNQLGLTAAAYNQAVSKGTLPTDFDLIWDAPVAYTGECTVWFALQTPVATNMTGFALVMSGATSYAIRNYVNGVNQGVLTSATGPTITAGDMFWLYRRGTLLRLYYKRGAGDWTKILEVTSSLYPSGGIFAFELSDVATRIDNVRGGVFSGLGPSISTADSVTTSDGFTSVWDATFAPADTVTTSDAPSLAMDLVLNVADSVTTSDSLALQMDYALLGAAFGLAETVTVTDDASGIGIDYTLDVTGDTVTTDDSLTLTDFTPLAISGCSLWLDASVLTPGASVPTWANLAPGFALTGVRMGSPPIVQPAVAGINGLPVVRFLKGQGAFASGATGIDRDYTFFIVARMLGTNNQRIVGGNNGTPNFLVGWWQNVMDVAFCQGWLDGNSTGVPATTATKLYSLDSATAPFAPRLFSDGAQIRGSGGGAAGGWAGNFGLGEVNTGENSDFELGEIIFYNRKLSDVERQSVESYLRTRWITPGAALTITPSDSVTVLDDGSGIVEDVVITGTDSVTTSDLPGWAQDSVTSYADTATTSDVATLGFDIAFVFSDTVTTTDADSWVQAFVIGVVDGLADSVAPTDSLDIFAVGISVTFADTVTTSEALSLDFAYTFADTVTTTDSLQLDFVIPLDISDSVTVYDTPLIAKPDERPQFSFAFSYAYELSGVIGGGYAQESGGGARTTVISKSGGGIEVSAGGEHVVFVTDWTITPADSVTTSDSESHIAALGIDNPLDAVAISDVDSWVENYVVTFADSVTTSDDASNLSLDIPRSFADTVTTSDIFDLVNVIPKDGGATEGSFTGLSKLTKVAQTGGGIETAVGGAVWASNALKSGGGIEGGSGGGDAVKALVVAKSGGATSAESGAITANVTTAVSKSGGAVEGSVGGIAPTSRLISESGGGISAEYGAVHVGLVKFGGAQSTESGGISRLVIAAKAGQGTEEEIGGGAVSTLRVVSKSGGATEGSVAGGTWTVTLIITKAGGAAEPQTAGAARATFLVKSLGAISAETASGHPTIVALFVKSGGGISSENGSGSRSMLYVLTKSGGGFEIQVSGGQRQSIHRLVGGGQLSETGGGHGALLMARSGGATTGEIGGLSRLTFYSKRHGGISPERGGGYGRRIKTYQEGGAESPESGGGSLNFTIGIPPGQGQEGELVGTDYGATLIGASSSSSTGQLVGATSGAMVLSGIEKAILVAAQEEVTFE